MHVEPDDAELVGDGIDATRVVLRVTNEHGGDRPFSTGAIALRLDGPGEIVGENPFALAAGVGAVWVRSKEAAGHDPAARAPSVFRREDCRDPGDSGRTGTSVIAFQLYGDQLLANAQFRRSITVSGS